MPRQLERAAVESRLREKGLRATRPRVAVYAALGAVGGHRSVDELVALLAARGTNLPRMSVYNVVSDLTAAGLLMCADTGPGRAVYEASDVWHHHFVCRDCGIVIDVPCARGAKPCMELPENVPARADEAQVIFRGRCDACARRNSPSGTRPNQRGKSPTSSTSSRRKG
jgi:Fur family ferric uptake transcriptional regulator